MNSTKLPARSSFPLLIVIAILVCSSSCGVFRSGVPNNRPDSILIANYEKNKPEFNQLLIMLARDVDLQFVTKNGEFRLNEKVPRDQRTKIQSDIEARISEYTELLSKINVERVNIDARHIKLYVAGEEKTSGKTVTGWEKGYRFLKTPDTAQYKVIDNLDNKGYKFSPENREETYLRRIDQAWYLYLQIQQDYVFD